MGASTKRRPRPAGLNYVAIIGTGAPALLRSGTVGAAAPSVPLPSVPLRHVAVVLLPSIGLVAAAMLLFYAGPVLAGLLYIARQSARPTCPTYTRGSVRLLVGHVPGEFERCRARSGADVPFLRGGHALLGGGESGVLSF